MKKAAWAVAPRRESSPLADSSSSRGSEAGVRQELQRRWPDSKPYGDPVSSLQSFGGCGTGAGGGGAWEPVSGPTPYIGDLKQATSPLWSSVTSLCCGNWWSITDTSFFMSCPHSVEG